MNTAANVFLDARSEDAAVLRSAAELKGAGAPVHVWTRVANSPSYRPFHRAVAIQQLIKRHVAKAVTLDQAAGILGGGNWLMEAEVEKIEEIGGEIPVRIPTGGRAYVIRFPSGASETHLEVGAYLALNRDLDTHILRDGLSGAIDDYARQTQIVDIAVFPECLEVPRTP